MTISHAGDTGRSTIPTDVDGLTAPWLSALLRSAGNDVEILSVESEPVGSGQMAGSYRLTPTWATPGDLPRTMVAKLAVGERAQREFAAGVFHNEVLFYQRLAPTLTAPIPLCHAAVISDDHTEFVLLLEDMAPSVQGDQILGCTPEQAHAVALAAAGLHAPRWCDVTLTDLPGLALPTHDDRLLMDSVIGPMADVFRSRFDLSGREAATIDWLVATAGDWLERDPRRFALIHGDLRIDNILFGPDGSVTIVDWQTITVGNPMRDIAFLLATSLRTDDRRAHEREIVAAYHAALLAHGVTDYSLDDCWSDYVDSLIQAPMIIVFGCGAAMPTERGDRMFTTMLERAAAAIDDVNPGALA
ncbi:oxidoreductase family protein [Gordonia sp. SL306]|uniref:oxidoreductase family protein n=1 Tax=Gordonia sp. SL306 TaxID=2995145 RepID=UPI00226F2E7B|nr:oxidoreductase family protein [Gordonia sp. SL306]WAC56632.1 phosphotransferase [Gordonia sp. SL306]